MEGPSNIEGANTFVSSMAEPQMVFKSQSSYTCRMETKGRSGLTLWVLLITVLISWSGCGKNTRPQADSEKNSSTSASLDLKKTRNKTPNNTPINFKPGPLIIPGDDLVKYFEANGRTPEGKRIYFKIPVIFKMRTDFPGAVQEAFIGVTPDLDEDEKVRLDIDDSGMGIGLSDRLLSLCDGAQVCKGWLFGFWGPLMDIEIIPDLSSDEKPGGPPKYPFAMRDLKPLEGVASSNQEARIWIQE